MCECLFYNKLFDACLRLIITTVESRVCEIEVVLGNSQCLTRKYSAKEELTTSILSFVGNASVGIACAVAGPWLDAILINGLSSAL